MNNIYKDSPGLSCPPYRRRGCIRHYDLICHLLPQPAVSKSREDRATIGASQAVPMNSAARRLAIDILFPFPPTRER
jgi:hypothetical protein